MQRAKRERTPAALAAGTSAITMDAVQILLKKQASRISPVVQVLSIHRYVLDTTFQDVTGEDTVGPAVAPTGNVGRRANPHAQELVSYGNGYDLVIIGMLQRLRCVLSPQLNALVHDGTIAPMVALQLDGWVYPRYNELVIGGGDPLVIITKVTPLFVKADCLLPLLTATNLPWAVPGHERRLPLTGHRAYYLAVFDDTSPYGGRWDDTHTDAEESDDEVDITAWNWDTNTRLDIDDVSESAASIDDALKLTNRYHPESRLLAMHRPAGQQLPARRVGTSAQELVFGVIIKKSSLLHYGKKNKHCKCPFNFHVIIQDRERTTAKVTFWTSP